MTFAKFLRTCSFTEHLRWLLLRNIVVFLRDGESTRISKTFIAALNLSYDYHIFQVKIYSVKKHDWMIHENLFT